MFIVFFVYLCIFIFVFSCSRTAAMATNHFVAYHLSENASGWKRPRSTSEQGFFIICDHKRGFYITDGR